MAFSSISVYLVYNIQYHSFVFTSVITTHWWVITTLQVYKQHALSSWSRFWGGLTLSCGLKMMKAPYVPHKHLHRTECGFISCCERRTPGLGNTSAFWWSVTSCNWWTSFPPHDPLVCKLLYQQAHLRCHPSCSSLPHITETNVCSNADTSEIPLQLGIVSFVPTWQTTAKVSYLVICATCWITWREQSAVLPTTTEAASLLYLDEDGTDWWSWNSETTRC